MKEITIYTETSEPIIINDEDNTNIEEYSNNLSSILQEGNVVVLQTSGACMILRPSRITGIEVKETNIKKFINPPNAKKKKSSKKPAPKKIVTKNVDEKNKDEDIITDE